MSSLCGHSSPAHRTLIYATWPPTRYGSIHDFAIICWDLVLGRVFLDICILIGETFGVEEGLLVLVQGIAGAVNCSFWEFESGVVDGHVEGLDLGIRNESVIGSKPLLVGCGFLRLLRLRVDDHIILRATMGRDWLTCKMLRSIFFWIMILIVLFKKLWDFALATSRNRHLHQVLHRTIIFRSAHQLVPI